MYGGKTGNKKQDGVMMLVRKDVRVDEVCYGKGIAEMIQVGIRQEVKSRGFAVVCVPSNTRSWRVEEYETMMKDTSEEMADY